MELAFSKASKENPCEIVENPSVPKIRVPTGPYAPDSQSYCKEIIKEYNNTKTKIICDKTYRASPIDCI